MEVLDTLLRIEVRDGEHTAEITLHQEEDGSFVAGELISSGSEACLHELLRLVKDREPYVLFIIDDSNPRKAGLERLYRMFGAKYIGKVYRSK